MTITSCIYKEHYVGENRLEPTRATKGQDFPEINWSRVELLWLAENFYSMDDIMQDYCTGDEHIWFVIMTKEMIETVIEQLKQLEKDCCPNPFYESVENLLSNLSGFSELVEKEDIVNSEDTYLYFGYC